MSERTTIGGTVYEAIGSSSSNLLLKCNGTARIQWGGKLIDLIKNGKIASGDSQELVFIVSDESKIKSDGVYVLTTEESNYLWICKDGNKYNLTNSDLYISASKPQTLTAEQKKQALDNIGFQYNTLDDVKQANLKNGLVYVIDTNMLYTIKNGYIEEFKASLTSIAVDNNQFEGDVINGKVKLVLSVADDEYLVLADQRITANYSIHVKDSAQIGSEEADETKGYRLYIDKGTSWLEVDEINVRNGIKIKLYEEVTFEALTKLISSNDLKPHAWYLITDFQNHWNLTSDSDFKRPILVRALTQNSLYEWGYLFRDHRIKLKYDYTFQENITRTIQDEDGTKDIALKSKGKITWMLDTRNNNQANFDFMDYKNANKEELAILHSIKDDDSEDKSIFPYGSHDNTLIAHNLKGTVIVDGRIDDSNANEVNFMFEDSEADVPNDATEPVEKPLMEMYNNVIECRGLVVKPTCSKFYNNTLNRIIKLEIHQDFTDNNIQAAYYREDFIIYDFSEKDFNFLGGDSDYSVIPFEYAFKNVTCQEFRHCTFLSEITNSNFGVIDDTIFNMLVDKTTINSIIRPGDTYIRQLYNINNSTIDEISGEAQFTETSSIINSNINKISEKSVISGIIDGCNIGNILECQIEGSVLNSNIEEISQNSIIVGSIEQCTINNIINGSIIKSELNNSTINDIDNSVFEAGVSNSTFNNITNSKILAEISNSVFNNLGSCDIEGAITNCHILDMGNSSIKGAISDSTFSSIFGSKINNSISNSKFVDLTNCTLDASIDECTFKSVSGSFSGGSITNTISFYDLSGNFNPDDYYLLFDAGKRKEVYLHNGKIRVYCVPDVVFYRGMIIMHSGIEEIPKGWAPCDGGTYEWEGVISQTPNLINKFIKSGDGFIMGSNAVGDNDDTVDPNLTKDNKLKLTKDHLPTHRHPHLQHSHSASQADSNYVDSYSYSYTDSTGEDSRTEYDTSYDNRSVSHTHTIYPATSVEDTSITFKNELFSIEPHAYKLIFIMKL